MLHEHSLIHNSVQDGMLILAFTAIKSRKPAKGTLLDMSDVLIYICSTIENKIKVIKKLELRKNFDP